MEIKVYVYGDSKEEVLDTLTFDYTSNSGIPRSASWKGCGYRISNTMVTKDPLEFISDEPDDFLLQGTFYFYYDN